MGCPHWWKPSKFPLGKSLAATPAIVLDQEVSISPGNGSHWQAKYCWDMRGDMWAVLKMPSFYLFIGRPHDAPIAPIDPIITPYILIDLGNIISYELSRHRAQKFSSFLRNMGGERRSAVPLQDWLLTRTNHQHLQRQHIWMSTCASSLLPDSNQGKNSRISRSWRVEISSVQHPILLQKHGPTWHTFRSRGPRVCVPSAASMCFRIQRWWWEHEQSQHRPSLTAWGPQDS